MAEIKITESNFKAEVLEADKPVLIDFWATWCGPCRMLAPNIEAIAQEYDGKLKVGKVNVDEEPALAQAFQVASIPTIVVMQGGKIVKKSVGFQHKVQLVKLFEDLI